MPLRNMKYYAGQSLYSIWRNKLMSLISMSTVCFCLILLGVAILIGDNLQYISKQLQAQFEIQAFMDSSASQAQVNEMENKIKALTGVAEVVVETPEEGIEWFKQEVENGAEAFEGLEGENNPLPYCFKVTLSDASQAENIEKSIQSMNQILQVNNRRDVLNSIVHFTKGIRWVSLAGMLIFALIAVFIISNTIKLAVMARSREISIMKSVGATDWFIRWPFIIEGAIVGLIGAIIAFFPVFFGYRGIALWWSGLLDIVKLVDANMILGYLILAFCLIGIGIGSIGSIMAVRKHLRV